MIQIKNKDQLLKRATHSKSLLKAREIVLDSLEAGVNAVDPRKIVTSMLSLEGSLLMIEELSFDLAEYKNIYVVGGGKAAGPMAEALEGILNDRITAGLVNVPYGSCSKTKYIGINEASHPLPDESSVNGTRRILEVAEQAQVDDLIICLISGGGSSLMAYPIEGVTIQEKRDLTAGLLRSGATINEINTVRKHLSRFKGGLLARAAYPATVLNLVLSDVVGDPLDVIASGSTVADSTTFGDAHMVLVKYGLWTESPSSIQKIISDGERGLIDETPKANDQSFERVHNFILANNRTACLAAAKHLKSQGLKTLLLTCTAEGEAKCIGGLLSSITNEIALSGNPSDTPVAIVLGGETTVKVSGKGLGGRNQELVLSAVLKLRGNRPIVIASMATDGVDGPTDAAGAIIDSTTCLKAEKLNLNPEEYLRDNDSYHYFLELEDLIFTGQTGTNVNDISIVVVF
jgi:glycerate 2-kinase